VLRVRFRFGNPNRPFNFVGPLHPVSPFPIELPGLEWVRIPYPIARGHYLTIAASAAEPLTAGESVIRRRVPGSAAPSAQLVNPGYLTRVRRRWIRITSTITNNTPETIWITVVLLISLSFLF
jgi:hypothetical protein